MIRFAADEDFDNDIIRALERRISDTDIVRVQDADLSGATDAVVLAWAADQRRVLLTHDPSTMSFHALERLRIGESMPGLIVAHQRLPIGDVIEDLVLVATVARPKNGLATSTSYRCAEPLGLGDDLAPTCAELPEAR